MNLNVVGGRAVHGRRKVDGHEVELQEMAVGSNEVPATVKIRSILRTKSIKRYWLANVERKLN